MMSDDLPKLAIRTGTDHRSNMYRKIAEVHSQVTDAKRMSKFTGRPFQMSMMIVVHFEEAIAFLAEEMLRMGAKQETDADQPV
jgi:hypothetical protein